MADDKAARAKAANKRLAQKKNVRNTQVAANKSRGGKKNN